MFVSPRFLAVLLSVTVVTGCVHAAKYSPPQNPLSGHFLSQEIVERRDAQRKADLQTWWAAFDDPDLTRFVSLALAQNLDIAQAAARVAQSRASWRQAGAALLPSGDVSAHAAKVYQSRDPTGTGARRHHRLRPHRQLLRGQPWSELGNRPVRRPAARAGRR